MNKQYNLLDEPWLPVRFADGSVASVGLLEAFERSGDITALAETSPPGLLAEYRLLLAILHRALTDALGTWRTKDRATWYEEGLPVQHVRIYLEKWREKFWLFHPEHPFMQVAALEKDGKTREKLKPWTQISLPSASGNTPVVFDHSYDGKPSGITPREAIGVLLGFLQLTPGGLVKCLRDSDKAAPLANTAASLPVGGNLAQTLILALHPAPGKKTDETDLPSWEQKALSIKQLEGSAVLPSGPNDRYTRQTRAVLLRLDEDHLIRHVWYAAGYALGGDEQIRDPMANFREGKDGQHIRLTFTEGRALWRDLPALVAHPQHKSLPAAVIEYALNVLDELGKDEEYLPLLTAGMASDQAKLLRWRLEQISLPASVLKDGDMAQMLRTLVGKSEDVYRSIASLVVSMYADALQVGGAGDTEIRKRARNLLSTTSFGAIYFSALERSLKEVVATLVRGGIDEAPDEWSRAIREAAGAAYSNAVTSIGYSARALRAVAKYQGRYFGILKKEV